MRKLFIVLGSAALISASAVTFAQRGNIGNMVERMTEKLQLNTTQVEQVTSIMEVQQQKRLALREDTKSKLSAVLTEEQLVKMEEMRAMHENRRGDKGERCMNKQ